MQIVPIRESTSLDDYASVVHLAASVSSLRAQAASLVPRLAGRRVWMVNSTARGGGVAEMLPTLISLLRELGVDVQWAVLDASRPKFFALTKRLHNLIHGCGDPELTAEDRQLYDTVSQEGFEAAQAHLRPEDVLVIHDPQPLGMGALLKREIGVTSIFRCHIGLDEPSSTARAAWRFLAPYAAAYDYSVFSAAEYIPDFLVGRAGVITPAIDPLGLKNRELRPQHLTGVLCNARLAVDHHPVVPLPFQEPARRLRPDGSFGPADHGEGIGMPYRPVVTQISRWDRLKGFLPLMEAFAELKRRPSRNGMTERHARRIELTRFVLAGPDPDAVSDDPEGREVLGELIERYRELPADLQRDLAIVCLPMGSRHDNELMVNALQSCSTVVVQNSLREGFGLTVTEAMWKRAAVLGSRACGIRQQIRDGVDGRLIGNPEQPEEIAALLDEMLDDLPGCARLGESAQRRVHDEFLVFTQARRWLEVLTDQLER